MTRCRYGPRSLWNQSAPEERQDRLDEQRRLAHTVPNITRNNHHVPEATLKRWSTDGERVWAYRLLVSHRGVRNWRRELISGLTRYHSRKRCAVQGLECRRSAVHQGTRLQWAATPILAGSEPRVALC
jgi:hypothetical protein